MPSSSHRAALALESARLEEGAAHYEQSHRLAAGRWRLAANSIGGAAAVASALAAGIAAAGDDGQWYIVGLSVAAAVAAAVLTFFKPAERAADHTDASVGFNLLRHDLRRFRLIEVTESSEEELTKQLASLVDRRAALLRYSPDYSDRTFQRAIARVKEGVFEYAADTQTDAELNHSRSPSTGPTGPNVGQD